MPGREFCRNSRPDPNRGLHENAHHVADDEVGGFPVRSVADVLEGLEGRVRDVPPQGLLIPQREEPIAIALQDGMRLAARRHLVAVVAIRIRAEISHEPATGELSDLIKRTNFFKEMCRVGHNRQLTAVRFH